MRLKLQTAVTAKADKRMHHETVKNLWRGFTLTCSVLSLEDGPENTFVLGNCQIPHLPEGKEYALEITSAGAAVIGQDYGGLMRGYISLLMKIGYNNLDEGQEDLFVEACSEVSRYKLKNRMIHLCVFPETELHFLKQMVRLCGVLQFTHVVIEFWGMLQYDALKELAWPQAYSKDQIRDVIRQVRELGMEPVPMLNQLGHAAMSRAILGKHTVLDQNPRLQTLFTPDGWAWDIYSPKVRKLLKALRAELYDLFGPGEYIHIGCDEADYYILNRETRKDIGNYLHDLTTEVACERRRPMMWMDMLLEEVPESSPRYFGSATAQEAAERRSKLAPETVCVDWQYIPKNAPVESLTSLKDCGHDVIGAPWYIDYGYKNMIDTLVQYDMFGVMMTTWHVLCNETPQIVELARYLDISLFSWEGSCKPFYVASSILRRVSFDGCNYLQAGWKQKQIEV
ncbi:MAG: family 20 glycosylhydrolase [Oscillospiraceae bacterium]|nr:family 20 glycosylhydrolase [Oscillospiraceae bacterium]